MKLQVKLVTILGFKQIVQRMQLRLLALQLWISLFRDLLTMELLGRKLQNRVQRGVWELVIGTDP